jgi:hypothetical protein
MATNLVEITKSTQDQFFGALGAVQDTIVENYAKVATATTKYVPDNLIPASRELPLIGNPAAYVELGFGFAAKLLDSQKAFADKVLAVAAVAAPKAPAPKAAASK